MASPEKRVSTTLKNLSEHKSGFDLYVAPPGRGTPQVNKGLRLEQDFVDAMERLVSFRNDQGQKLFPYKSSSDVMRAALHLGFKYLLMQCNSEEMSELASQMDAMQQSQAKASMLLKTNQLIERNKEILTNLFSAGALEEAQAFWREQWKASDQYKGYQQSKVQKALDVFRAMLFKDGKVDGLAAPTPAIAVMASRVATSMKYEAKPKAKFRGVLTGKR